MPRAPCPTVDMSISPELSEIVDFLAQHAPFDRVQQSLLVDAARQMEIIYRRKGEVLLNIGAANSGRYLKIGVILELKPDKNAKPAGKTMSPEEIRIQDAVLHVLRSQSITDYDPQKQDRLKELIKQEVNRVVGRDIVMEVYITNILLQ